ncbi:hypothetical protein GOP47_0026538 [Adiantum capillus-veneris]|nr:hypothetical protein GOP47_0026538 [Adiantum capillus-veneris]
MIKQILNRLPRRNSFDGNESAGRPSACPIEANSNDSSTNSAPSRELLVTTYKLSGPTSRKATDGSAPNGTIVASPMPATIVASSTTTAPVESLPLFRDVPLSERPTLFLAKLHLCSNIFDFRDPTKNLKEKDIKKQTLLELVDFISAGNMEITEQVIEEVTKMVAANLFRSLPPFMHENAHLESFDLDDEEPTMEPAWPHLQAFVLKLIELFDSEDSREREYLKTVLHRVYGKFMVHRAFIRKAINNVFYRFVFETERHNGIAELLEILGSIINGFACPLKEEHKTQSLGACLSTGHSQIATRRQLGRCLNSPHFQVAERALFFWNNDHFVTLVIPNRSVILPLIFPALEKNTNGHWNQAIHGMTMNARKLFLETDQELFQESARSGGCIKSWWEVKYNEMARL